MRHLGFLFILAFCCDAKYVPEDGVYSVVENMPEYEAGMHAFESHVRSYIADIEEIDTGSVFISFIVATDGKLKEVKVVKSLNDVQDDLALNAVKNAPLKWKPGYDEGKAVEVKMVYPISFPK